MATLGEGEGEPLDGENGAYRSDGEDGEYDASTTDGNEEPVVVAAAPFPQSDLRESLGFLRATRRLALPGAGFDKESDDGSVIALAAVDVFGLLLMSSATGVLHFFEKGTFTAADGQHPRCRRRQRLPTAAPGVTPLEPCCPSSLATMLLLDCYQRCISRSFFYLPGVW